MTAQTLSWRSIFPCCGILDVPAVPKPKARQTTDQIPSRLGFLDLSNPNSLTLSEDLSISLARSNIHSFCLEELKLITQSFSSNFLGEGGFGPVHKGFIDDRVRPGLKARPVAVKLLDLDGAQGHREWLAEVILLGQLRHPHLVKLIGYCCEDEHRLLVYEGMPRGSLENQLCRSMAGTPEGEKWSRDYSEMLLEQQTSISGDGAARYAVLSTFLTQTEEYLHKLGSKITTTKCQQEGEEAAAAAAAQTRISCNAVMIFFLCFWCWQSVIELKKKCWG